MGHVRVRDATSLIPIQDRQLSRLEGIPAPLRCQPKGYGYALGQQYNVQQRLDMTVEANHPFVTVIIKKFHSPLILWILQLSTRTRWPVVETIWDR